MHFLSHMLFSFMPLIRRLSITSSIAFNDLSSMQKLEFFKAHNDWSYKEEWQLLAMPLSYCWSQQDNWLPLSRLLRTRRCTFLLAWLEQDGLTVRTLLIRTRELNLEHQMRLSTRSLEALRLLSTLPHLQCVLSQLQLFVLLQLLLLCRQSCPVLSRVLLYSARTLSLLVSTRVMRSLLPLRPLGLGACTQRASRRLPASTYPHPPLACFHRIRHGEHWCRSMHLANSTIRSRTMSSTLHSRITLRVHQRATIASTMALAPRALWLPSQPPAPRTSYRLRPLSRAAPTRRAHPPRLASTTTWVISDHPEVSTGSTAPRLLASTATLRCWADRRRRSRRPRRTSCLVLRAAPPPRQTPTMKPVVPAPRATDVADQRSASQAVPNALRAGDVPKASRRRRMVACSRSVTISESRILKPLASHNHHYVSFIEG